MILEIDGKPCVPLKFGQLYLIGKRINGEERQIDNFIELAEEEEVNERHCIIEVSHKEQAFVFDLFSLKGTLLNDKELNSLEKTLLNNGDVLKLGKREIKYIHENEMSGDSSGFLEINKNTSEIAASSPDTTAQLEVPVNLLVPSIPSKILNDSSSASSGSRSNSFIIPETQFCRSRNSFNGSNLSIAESIPDDINVKVKFKFGNTDSFQSLESDDDFCIPETQEAAAIDIAQVSKNQRALSDIQGERNGNNISETCSKEAVNATEFRISTQEYNEGFGEEEFMASFHSQIIPIITHPTVHLNSTKSSHVNPLNQSNISAEGKDMSALLWSNSRKDQEETAINRDCPTPDIFDFNNWPKDTKVYENSNKTSTLQNINSQGREDEEDLLPTQVLSSAPLIHKKEADTFLNEQQGKPCVEIENEEVLSLSGKENRCPDNLELTIDLQPTQLLEARLQNSYSSRRSIISGVKENTSPRSDKENGSLTDAVVLDKKSLQNKALNSTPLNNEVLAKNPIPSIAEMDKTPLKEIASTSTDFKMPDKDVAALKKVTLLSTNTENDIDLLMCTPQIIKDIILFEGTETLKKNILEAKNSNMLGEETQEEDDDDDDDDERDLVKLINVPKDSLDFDKLLPHLSTKARNSKITTEQEKASTEAHKKYKFNIFFGKEQDNKQAKLSVTKSSTFSRDERHAARDKERTISVRKGRTKTTAKKKETTHEEKALQPEEITTNNSIGHKKTKTQERNEDVQKRTAETVENKSNNNEKTNADDSGSNQNGTTKRKTTQRTKTSTVTENVPERSTNTKATRKRDTAAENKMQKGQKSVTFPKIEGTPAKRVTRSKSKFSETALTANEDDLDSIATLPVLPKTRSRYNSATSECQDNSSTSGKNIPNAKKTKTDHNLLPNPNATTMKPARKRKADSSPSLVPVKVVLKNLRRSKSASSSVKKPISISMTMVEQELSKSLLENSKGLWSIATNCADSEILVMDTPYRTFKFLMAMARGIPIVTSEYLKKLNETKSVKQVPISDYYFANANFEKKYKFSLLKARQAGGKLKIFDGYEFLMTASILPNTRETKTIIETCGGRVHEKTPPQPQENQKLYLVSANEDKKEWHKYRRLNKNIIIVPTEAIMSAVMTQISERMNKYILL